MDRGSQLNPAERPFNQCFSGEDAVGLSIALWQMKGDYPSPSSDCSGMGNQETSLDLQGDSDMDGSFPTTIKPMDSTGTDTVVSLSTSFWPGAHSQEWDIVFCSTDGVLFYVHSSVIAVASPHAFSSFLPASPMPFGGQVISIPESSATLNIVLHSLYGTSCAANSPTLGQLVEAVDCMPKYGIVPSDLIIPQTALYTLLLSHAPHSPVEIYALASHHNITALAEAASSHLLAFPCSNISDQQALKMGPVYLMRLLLLQHARVATLKELLTLPPQFHPETKQCKIVDQKKMIRAWALASASLIWEARPGVYLISSRKHGN
ncbi:hypothetical protein CC2G_012723 [Coprinopsis cinerea AmutBmut pab1-1]|nr:hypothetical protein CC2G_012723 [Coprinopsis cinerea AmutBmut pab1-1]